MRKIISFLVVLLCGIVSVSWAYQVPPTGVYWDMEVAYGSGSNIGDGTLNSEQDSYLTPSIPHSNGLPDTSSLEISESNDLFYAYSDWSADTDEIDADVQGYADGTYSTTDTDWYSALSKVAVGSNLFDGATTFSLTFDWETYFDISNTTNNSGTTKYAVGLIDWTLTTDPNNPSYVYNQVFEISSETSGSFSQSWNLDPTHQYLWGVGALAELTGYEDSNGGAVGITLENFNPQATPVPEPATLFLLGSGLGLVGLASRKKKNK